MLLNYSPEKIHNLINKVVNGLLHQKKINGTYRDENSDLIEMPVFKELSSLNIKFVR